MGIQKISMNLSDEVLDALREVAARDNVTMTEATRRAISTWKFLDDAQRAGSQVIIRDPRTNESERVIFR